MLVCAIPMGSEGRFASIPPNVGGARSGWIAGDRSSPDVMTFLRLIDAATDAGKIRTRVVHYSGSIFASALWSYRVR
jgi:hypothetical protein